MQGYAHLVLIGQAVDCKTQLRGRIFSEREA
jgi:hypothetical protein